MTKKGRLRNGLAGLLLALSLTAPLPVSAGVDMGGKAVTTVFSDAEIDQLMKVTGIESSIAAAPALVRAAVERGQPDISDDQRLQLADVTNNGRIVDLLIEMVRNDVRTKLDVKSFKEITEWFTSPTGKKLIAAEQNAAKPDGREKMQKAMLNGAATVLDFDRSRLLNDLDFATRASATQKLTLDDFLAILSVHTNNEQKFQEVQKSILVAQRDMENNMLYAMNSVYEEVTDDEIRAYVNFYRTPVGQKWVDILRSATRSLWRLVNESSVNFLVASEKAPMAVPR